MKISQDSFIDFHGVITFDESRYMYGDGNGWKASTLYEQAKKEEALPFDLHLNSIDISLMPFKILDLYDFVVHCKRMADTNTDYPVLLGETGQILDGWHRIAKAILTGCTSVRAFRLSKNPPFDYTPDDK